LSPQIKKAANAAFNKTVPNFLSCRFGRGFFGAGFWAAIFLAEFIDAPSGVHNLLCTRIERVALGADFNVQGRFAEYGLGLEAVTATARYGDLLVIWMYFCFHFISSLEVCAAGVRTGIKKLPFTFALSPACGGKLDRGQGLTGRALSIKMVR
jgi:hypothetical protein